MSRVLWISSLAFLFAGCAASTPPPRNAEEPKAAEPSKEAAPSAPAEPPPGKLDPVEIQKVVRANFKPLRTCYEAGLQKNPNLEGRMAARFVIGTDGKVSGVQDGSPESFPDPDVVKCVLAAIESLTFPAPEGGVVKVVYPLMFSAGGGSDAMSNCKKSAEEKDGIRTVSITCDKQSFKVTDMPAKAVDDKFADAMLTGFE